MTTMNPTQELYAVARQLHEKGGLSPLPCTPGGKGPAGKWKPFEATRITASQLASIFNRTDITALGTLCGKVAGNLCVMDFDVPRFYDVWRRDVGELGDGLVCQKTGGGGYHVLFRCDNPGNNQKLAWAPNDAEKSGRETAIETRAEGGFILLAPSIHPDTGVLYEVAEGSLLAIPTIDQDRADALLAAARKLDEAPFTRQDIERMQAAETNAGESPRRAAQRPEASVIDTYNARTSPEDALHRCGYTEGERGMWKRPAAPGEAVHSSVTVRDGRTFHHSTNDILNDKYWHRPFDLVLHYEHGGDVKAAVKALAAEMGMAITALPAAPTRPAVPSQSTKPPPCLPPTSEPIDVGPTPESIDDAGDPPPLGPLDAAKAQSPWGTRDWHNAQRLAWYHRDEIRYDSARGAWRFYDGRRWTVDHEGVRLSKLAAGLADKLLAEARELPDRPDLQAGLMKAAAACLDKKKQDAIIGMAARQEAFVVDPGLWNTDDFLLNVRNGTLDLRTGKLRPHNPADNFTSLAPVDFDPDAQCPNFGAFLSTILDGSKDLMRYVMRTLGMCLTGDIREQNLWIFHGGGNNGKSTLVDVVMEIMGPDYACAAPDALLVVSGRQEHPTELAMLDGKRLVIASETEKNQRLKLALIKRLVGDKFITARFMHQNFYTFRRTHKTIMLTNNKPRVAEDSKAVWRRLRLTPFNVTIPDDQVDKALPGKLLAEASGILAVLAKACVGWQREGLAEPASVTDATAEYREESKPLREFFDECCILAPNAWDSSTRLWAAYREWCPRGPQIKQHEFWEELRKERCEPSPSPDRKQRGWRGIRLVSTPVPKELWGEGDTGADSADGADTVFE